MGRELRIGALTDFADGRLVPVDADGKSLIVARVGDDVHVAVNRCPHLGFSLTKGPGGMRYEDGVVTCPWHNSTFDVCTGENLDWVSGFGGRSAPRWSRGMIRLGRKAAGLTLLPVAVRDGDVVVTVD